MCSAPFSLERCWDDKSTPLRDQNLATDLETKNEGWRRLGGIQEEVTTSNAGQMEKDETTVDGGEESQKIGKTMALG